MGTKALVLPWVPAANFAPNRGHLTLMKTSNRAIALKSRLLLCWITFKEVLVSAKGVDEGDRD